MSAPPYAGVHFVNTLHTDIYPAIDPTKMPSLSQPSKAVLITGAGRGIGRSIAFRYAESGVECIILCARTLSGLEEVQSVIHKINSGIKVIKLALDISNEAAVLDAAKTVRETVGKLNVLVNNAGAGDPWRLIADGVADEYWSTFTVNVKGTYLIIKAFLPLLVETAKTTGGVDIINMTSIGALLTAPTASSYQVSKLAVLRLSEFVMVEYGAQGVNCVAVHPGAVLTELSKQLPTPMLPRT
jgi:NAD(P)-dependent dehydrogenase (short-subunit alcohol dehydrogenase family)